MAKSYRHLTYEQRCQIYILNKRGDSFSQIARIIGVHRSTISRELKRNIDGENYYCDLAHEKAQERRKESNCRKMTHDMILIIEEKLKLGLES